MLKLKNFIETKYGRTLPEIIANNSDNILILKEAYESLTGDLITDQDFQNLLATLFNNLWYTNRPEFIGQVRAILSSELEKRLETVPDDLIANTDFITKVADLVGGEYATKTELDELNQKITDMVTAAITWTNILAKDDRPTTTDEFFEYIYLNQYKKDFQVVLVGDGSTSTVPNQVKIPLTGISPDGYALFNLPFSYSANTNSNHFVQHSFIVEYHGSSRGIYVRAEKFDFIDISNINISEEFDVKITELGDKEYIAIPTSTVLNVLHTPLNLYILERDTITPEFTLASS